MLAWAPGLLVLIIIAAVFGLGDQAQSASELGRDLFFVLMGTFFVGLVAYLYDAWRRHRQGRHLPIA